MTRLALELDPDNQMARLALGLALLNTPPAFGGDPERAVEEIRTAFAGEGLAPRSLAGVWLAVAYARLGRNAEAANVIGQVLDSPRVFSPRGPPPRPWRKAWIRWSTGDRFAPAPTDGAVRALSVRPST